MIDELYDKLNQHLNNNNCCIFKIICDILYATDGKQFFFLYINDIFI